MTGKPGDESCHQCLARHVETAVVHKVSAFQETDWVSRGMEEFSIPKDFHSDHFSNLFSSIWRGRNVLAMIFGVFAVCHAVCHGHTHAYHPNWTLYHFLGGVVPIWKVLYKVTF